MKNRTQKLLALLVLLSAINHQLSTSNAQGTAFTYQGQLQNNGAPANGMYNLQFSLYTNSTGGTAVAGPVTNSAVTVSNGLFTVTIDFGAAVWNGQTNWLQIGVEANGSNSFTLLSPLQQVTPTPYAISAESAVALASGTAIGMGAANTISGGIADSFIGGGDENTIYALDSVIGGGYFNIIYPNASYSMIGGGYFNIIYPNASYSMIGGGYDNLIEQGNSFIGGGDANTVDQENSFIGSGSQNQNQSFESVIVGGADNVIYPNAQYSAIGGGLINRIYGDTNDYGTSVIAGGYEITINSNSWNSFIGGGGNNTIGTNSDHSVVVGGYANTIQGVSQYATIGGGVGNSVAGFASAVSGGQGNSIQTNAYGSFIGGGAANVIGPDGISGFYTTYSVIGGGFNNTVDEFDSFIGGGQQNVIAGLADHSVIGGGEFNQIIGALTGPAVASVIGGGQGNVIQTNVDFSFIGGGFGNTIQSNTLYAVIPGGSNNVAGGIGSFAAGTSAQATNNGAFVWSDNSSPNPFSSTTPNQFSVRALGGVRLVTGGTGMTLDGNTLGPLGGYLFAYSTTPQIVTPSIFQNVTFTTDAQLNGWISFNASGTQFQCNQTGLYLVQYTAEASFQDSMSMRGELNLTEIPGSQAYVSTTTFGTTTEEISKTFLASIGAGNILTIQYTGNSPSDELLGGGSGATLPSVSLTITRIQ